MLLTRLGISAKTTKSRDFTVTRILRLERVKIGQNGNYYFP